MLCHIPRAVRMVSHLILTHLPWDRSSNRHFTEDDISAHTQELINVGLRFEQFDSKDQLFSMSYTTSKNGTKSNKCTEKVPGALQSVFTHNMTLQHLKSPVTSPGQKQLASSQK